MVSQPVVKVDSLTKQYGNFLALTDCSFSVSQGEVFGLLGPNGSGKTTLLRLLMGFLRPPGKGFDIHIIGPTKGKFRDRMGPPMDPQMLYPWQVAALELTK